MVKKIAALVGAGAVLMGIALPVLARGGRHHRGSENVDVAIVENSASAVADSGLNSQGNLADVDRASVRGDVEVSGDNAMTTGDASAGATAVVIANTDVSCGCRSRRDCECEQDTKDIANVGNSSGATAYTGTNDQGNEAQIADTSVGGGRRRGGHHRGDEGEVEVSGDNAMTSGSASSTADAWVVVNTDLRMGR